MKILLRTGGIIEIVMSILHFPWPFIYKKSEEFQSLSKTGIDFLILNSFAIGLCLGILGLLSLYFSNQIEKFKKPVLFFSYSQILLWIIRLVFEIIYPVQIKFYFINQPSILFKIGIVVILTIYISSTINILKTEN